MFPGVGARRRVGTRHRGPPDFVEAGRAHGSRGKGVVRSLTGVAKGLYRTIGAASTTNVRNATWVVQECCDGTLTDIGRGRATSSTAGPDLPEAWISRSARDDVGPGDGAGRIKDHGMNPLV